MSTVAFELKLIYLMVSPRKEKIVAFLTKTNYKYFAIKKQPSTLINFLPEYSTNTETYTGCHNISVLLIIQQFSTSNLTSRCS